MALLCIVAFGIFSVFINQARVFSRHVVRQRSLFVLVMWLVFLFKGWLLLSPAKIIDIQLWKWDDVDVTRGYYFKLFSFGVLNTVVDIVVITSFVYGSSRVEGYTTCRREYGHL